jgi:tRNA dimethylallyltransferase
MNAKNFQDCPAAVVVCGPTGIGKTSFAIKLARRFKGEIVGADSMQIYRHMDIGTAKPTPEERALVRHHMVNIVDPDEHFDAEKYAEQALAKIVELSERKVLPFVVGGTGLYIKALIYGLFETPKIDPKLRRNLKKEAVEKGRVHLHERLKACDPEAARRIHVNDAYRVVRALEVFEATAKTLSERQEAHRFRRQRVHTLKIGLKMERGALYKRIDSRVDLMIREGLQAEIENLFKAGYASDLKSMQSLGYRHMAAYLRGEIDWAETLRTLKRDTRRYAKRQMTWFNADPEIVWLTRDRIEQAEAMVRRFVAPLEGIGGNS